MKFIFREQCSPSCVTLLHRNLSRVWAFSRPEWVIVNTDVVLADAETSRLDIGERAAIALAERLAADLLLMDERRGVRIALSKGLAVTGTLGILDRAAQRGLIDVAECVEKLKSTNFRYRPEMLAALINKQLPPS